MIIRKQKTYIDHATTCAEMRIRMKKMYRICMVTLLFMIAVGSIQLKNDMISAASKKKAAKPKLTVPLSKVSLEGARLQRDANGRMIYTASVRNRSKKGTIKKIEYIYSAKVEQPSPTVETGDVSVRIKRKNVTLTAKWIKPGKISKPVSCSGDESGQISAMKLKKFVCMLELPCIPITWKQKRDGSAGVPKIKNPLSSADGLEKTVFAEKNLF